MADSKISDLTELSQASLEDNDELPIVDDSASETKKILWATLKNTVLALGKRVTTKTDDHTLALADINSVILMNVSALKTLTVPLNSSVAFTTGAVVVIINTGSNSTEVTAATGVTINKTADDGLGTILEDYESIALVKTATDTWLQV